MPTEVKRYHPVLIALHWLLALGILLAIFMGGFVLDEMKNTDPNKANLLRGHVTFGLIILALTVVRLVVRARTAKPAPLVTGKPLMDKLAVGIHHLLYTLTVLTALAGLGLALTTQIFPVLFQHTGNLPGDFDDFTAHAVHGSLAFALLGTIALHVAGALQHQLILKDGIMSRISPFSKE